jgi:hypothetical protein
MVGVTCGYRTRVMLIEECQASQHVRVACSIIPASLKPTPTLAIERILP